MHTLALAIVAIMLLILAAQRAPRILAANRGKALRNIAIWLAIFVALGTVYNVFGPGSKHPMFSAPVAPKITREKATPAPEGTDGGFVSH